jgi:hypothetical protein
MELKNLGFLTTALLLFSGCFKQESSPTGPTPIAPFKSSYIPTIREYWITTETTFKWDMVPGGEAMMTNDVVTPERRYLYKTIRYVQTDSQWNNMAQPEWQQLSGPIIRATVGDSVLVHFKNGMNSGMPLSIHPHNLVYSEANEGVWRKDRPKD